LRREQE